MNSQNDKTWVYCIVRTDLPLAQQMVQSGHAALEAGLKFPRQAEEPSSLIVLRVKTQGELLKARDYLDKQGIKTTLFFEPSWDYQYTALGTEPLTEDRRRPLRKFQLWKEA